MSMLTSKVSTDRELMTIHEVARYLHLSEAQVYKMVRAGRVPAIRIGKAWRFKKELLDEWITRESQLSLKPST
jgi:excisionase family DNA binding protein